VVLQWLLPYIWSNSYLKPIFLGIGGEKTPNELNNIIKNNATINSQDGIEYYRINLKKIFD
jgi:hypothetical protein